MATEQGKCQFKSDKAKAMADIYSYNEVEMSPEQRNWIAEFSFSLIQIELKS
jgi:hypothetical protein